MSLIQNPIIRGFNPDPSIIRVGKDYYIACSTFEWFPGVQIHHSRDLANWELICRPLDSIEKLDMKGTPDSCGVWAPCLSYHNGTFYLVYSNVKSFDGVWKDTPNYLITATNIKGPWSDPIFLSASGFDGSMFHSTSGKKWYTSMLVDHRKGKFFGGIILQEYSEQEQKLIGETYRIFEGTHLGKTEGPHIYEHEGYFYLITAEGGTEYGHAVSIARSKEIFGPYEMHPKNPLATCSNDPNHGLQKSGHGDLFWTDSGRCFIVFLVGRPLTPLGRCTLGRETAIAELEWKTDGWPYLVGGTQLPPVEIDLPNATKHDEPSSQIEKFENSDLSIHYQSLRIPMTEDWINTSDRPGWLKLIGKESLSSLHEQALIARRVQHFEFRYEVEMTFKPDHFQQMAGTVCYYNTGHYFYFFISKSKGLVELNVVMCDNFEVSELLESPIVLDDQEIFQLSIGWKKETIDFYIDDNESNSKLIATTNKGYILSDDYVREGSERYRPAFTGSFVGVACQDLSGSKQPAYFKELRYTAI